MLRERLESGAFVVTAEVGPPKGTDVRKMGEHAEMLAPHIDALNCTDNQSAVMRMSPVAASHLLKMKGVEPVMQLTCRDRNRLALQSELLGASALGIENVLCLTGDHVIFGDHKEAKSVFDIDSVQLLQALNGLNEGRDMSGKELEGATDFYAGAVVTPESEPMGPQLMKFMKKAEAGARFFQTQGIFDLDALKRFNSALGGLEVKILAGVILLTSFRMAAYLNEHIPGIVIPDRLLEKLKGKDAEEALDIGMDIAAETISAIKEEGLADGVHVMAIAREELVPEILRRTTLGDRY